MLVRNNRDKNIDLLFSENSLRNFLRNKSSFSKEEKELFHYYIDNFSKYWNIWNKVRWEESLGKEGTSELKEYLGEKFIPFFDSSWALAREWNEKKPHTEKEISDFYKKTKNYIYNLVIWHESGDRENYENEIKKIINKYNIKSVIDYGCGVGTDSIVFSKFGIKTYSIDFDCPAAKFFKWRMKKRNISCEFLDVEKLNKFPSADMFWAIDVLEHLPDPMKVIKQIDFESCKIFAHRSQFNNTAGGRHPCHINFESKIISDFLISLGFIYIDLSETLSVWVKKDLELANKID